MNFVAGLCCILFNEQSVPYVTLSVFKIIYMLELEFILVPDCFPYEHKFEKRKHFFFLSILQQFIPRFLWVNLFFYIIIVFYY